MSVARRLLVLAALPLVAAGVMLSAAPRPADGATGLWNDVDCDGAVDAVDSLKTLFEVAGLPAYQDGGCFAFGAYVPIGDETPRFGDADCDGRITPVDALWLLHFVSALPLGSNDPCPAVGTSVELPDDTGRGEVLAEYLGLDDPTSWSVDGATGLRYRRATGLEIAANHWQPGTFLVEASALVAATTTGVARAELLVPTSDGVTRSVELRLHAALAGGTKLQRRVTESALEVETTTPKLYHYLPSGFDLDEPTAVDGAWLELLAGEDGGVFATGIVDGREIAVDAPNPGWVVEERLAAAGGEIDTAGLAKVSFLSIGAIGEAQWAHGNEPWFCLEGWPVCDEIPDGNPEYHGCTNGGDDDADGRTDAEDQECQHHGDWEGDAPTAHQHRWESGISFALFGEGLFCTNYASNWFERLTILAGDARNLIHDSVLLPFVQSTFEGEMSLRFIAGGCWIFPSTAAVTTCHGGGVCDDAGEYPYAGADLTASSYYSNVWNDVQHGAEHGLNDVLHAAQVVHGTSQGLTCIATQCDGASVTNASAANQRGASVMRYLATYDYAVAAHELAHSLGVKDHNGIVVNGKNSYLNEADAGPASAITSQQESQLLGCLADWECPRPSGFHYPPP